jgi:hypothetical protein
MVEVLMRSKLKIGCVIFTSAAVGALVACSQGRSTSGATGSLASAAIWDEGREMPQESEAPGRAFHFDRWVSCQDLGLGNRSVTFRPPFDPTFAPDTGCGVDGGGRYQVDLGGGLTAQLASGYCFHFRLTSPIPVNAFLLRGTDYGAIREGADPDSEEANPTTKVNLYEPSSTTGQSSTPPRVVLEDVPIEEYYRSPGSYADRTSTPRELELCFTVEDDAGPTPDGGVDAQPEPDPDAGEIEGGKTW